MRVDFIIHTTPSLFYNWVHYQSEEHRREGKLDIPAQPSAISLQTIRSLEQLHDKSSKATLVMYGHYTIPGQDGVPLVLPPGKGHEYIKLTLIALDEKRTKIIAECLDGPAEIYFRQLLDSIAQDYPEVNLVIFQALLTPPGSRLPALRNLLDQETMTSLEVNIPFSFEEYRAATEQHLLSQQAEGKPAEQLTRIERDTEHNDIYNYIRHNFIGRGDAQNADNPNGAITNQIKIGYVSGTFANDYVTKLEVVSEGLSDPLVKRIVQGFVADWMAELESQSDPMQTHQTFEDGESLAYHLSTAPGDEASNETAPDQQAESIENHNLLVNYRPSSPSVPKRAVDLNRWKRIWKAIKGPYYGGTTLKALVQKKSTGCGIDTLRKIVAAGEAGLLD